MYLSSLACSCTFIFCLLSIRGNGSYEVFLQGKVRDRAKKLDIENTQNTLIYVVYTSFTDLWTLHIKTS